MKPDGYHPVRKSQKPAPQRAPLDSSNVTNPPSGGSSVAPSKPELSRRDRLAEAAMPALIKNGRALMDVPRLAYRIADQMILESRKAENAKGEAE